MGDIILYQDILNTYNIDPTYSFDELNYNLSEKVLMNIIFSKFITDRQYNSDTSKYISFILRSSALTAVNIDDIKLNTHYYRQNMIKTDKRSSEDSTPSLNAKIVDFDMTHFATNDIRNYCFYLDIIIEIYNVVHEIKVNKGSLIFDELMIKSRYYYDDHFPVLFSESSVGHFDLKIVVKRDEQTKALKDIEFVSEKPTNKILNIFKLDIMKHLEYINKEDITFANPSYVTDVINFYKLCRLKLMYSIVHSMYLSTSKDSSDEDMKNKMIDFIREYVLSVFINFKTLSSFDSSTDVNDEVYSNDVISKANKLRKVNESIRRRKDKLKTRNVMNKNTKDAMKKQSYINIAARVMIILVSLISLVLMFSEVDNKSKSILSMITIAIAIIGYVILMLISKSINSSTNFERFENSSNMVSLPQIPLTKNKMVHHDGNNLYFFRVEASSSLGEEDDSVSTHHPYFAFDGKLSTSWKSDNASTYVNGMANYTNVHSTLKGEYLMIDLCQFVDVESMTISFTEADCGPKSFTLLASDKDSLWDKKEFTSQNGNLKIDNASYDNTLTKTFNLGGNRNKRYFLLVIHELTGNGDHAEITSLKFNVKDSNTGISEFYQKTMNRIPIKTYPGITIQRKRYYRKYLSPIDSNQTTNQYKITDNLSFDIPQNVIKSMYKSELHFIGNPTFAYYNNPNTYDIKYSMTMGFGIVFPKQDEEVDGKGYYSHSYAGYYTREVRFGKNAFVEINMDSKRLYKKFEDSLMSFSDLKQYEKNNFEGIETIDANEIPKFSHIFDIKSYLQNFDLTEDNFKIKLKYVFQYGIQSSIANLYFYWLQYKRSIFR